MAHFAQLDNLNNVIQVIVVHNNETFRKNYAGYGFKYDKVRDAFIPPQPYLSWVLNNTTFVWEPPIPCPIDDKIYNWNESTLTWDEVPAVV